MTVEPFEILHFDSAGGRSTFADDVRRGLTARRKFLLPKYFYDPLGSHLFEAICHLPEYYLTRAEREILARHGDAVTDLLDGPHTLIELGSGSSVKTRLLMEALLKRQPRLHYLPIDISESALTRSARRMLEAIPGLRITAVAADYKTALAALAEGAGDRDPQARTLVVFLGSSIGNFDPAACRVLLSRIRAMLRPRDAFLPGTDLKKSSADLVPAYDDPLGVTSAFNLNLLVRINRELGGDFEIGDFRHRALYDEKEGRIEMYLESRTAQSVAIRDLDLGVHLARKERIHTENSYKFDPRQIDELAAATGFEPTQRWLDGKRRFCLSLLRA